LVQEVALTMAGDRRLTYLMRDGTVQIRTMKSIHKNMSWEKMNEITPLWNLSKEDNNFLIRYGLERTLFNVANLQYFGAIQLYPHFVKIVLDHGAIDQRIKPEGTK
jgi:hypothetical protein